MHCDDLIATLDDYLDEELGGDRGVEFEAHLASCRPCWALATSIRYVVRLYRDEGLDQLPDDVRQRLHRVLRKAAQASS